MNMKNRERRKIRKFSEIYSMSWLNPHYREFMKYLDEEVIRMLREKYGPDFGVKNENF